MIRPFLAKRGKRWYYCHMKEFLEEMRRRLGGEANDYIAALGMPPLKGLHINSVKARADFDIDEVCEARRLPYGNGCYEVTGGAPTAHPYYRAGLYYMQEPAAMLPIAYADIPAGAKVLDMCAAPGGKTSMAASALSGGGLLVSNDADRKRAEALRENIVMLGYTNTVVTCMRAERLPETFGGMFDVVIADVPCSGEGMMRKEPQAAYDWSLKSVRSCAERQRGIIDAADRCLKSGGLLVYSTCTFSEEEDEDNARYALSLGYEEEVPDDPFLGAARCSVGFKFYPHRYRGEGQYFCLLRKTGGGERERRLKPLSAAGRNDLAKLGDVLDVGGMTVARAGGMLLSPALNAELPCLVNGVLLASEEKDGRLTFAQQAASAFGCKFRSREDISSGDGRIAAYRRGEEIVGESRGWCAVCVDGYPLGLGKGSGGNIKNKLPHKLRSLRGTL